MSKELEALHTIAFNTQINGLNFGDELRTIEQALQRLEAIDNSKASEVLELVGYLKDYFLNMIPYCDWLNDIEKYILKSQEQEKVLEIIKEKPQAELSLIQLGKIKTYEEYLNYTGEWELDLYGDMVYTEEEFELLKRYFE